MNCRIGRTWIGFAAALVCALAFFSVARADDTKPIATTITIAPLDPVPSGTPVTIQVRLQTATGQKQGAVANENIDLSVDGVHQTRSKTDATGAVSFSLPGNLPIGKHTIKVEYSGSKSLLPSSAVAELVIMPAVRQPSQAAQGVASVLSIDSIAPISVGADRTVVARLSTPTGENTGAVGNEVVQLFIDDKPVRRARTDSSGMVSIHLPDDLPAGTHPLRIEYDGTRALLAASASTDLVVAPAIVQIQIIPALAGVRFSLNGREFVSDASGMARTEVDRAGTFPLEILPLASSNADIRIEFNRWLDDVFTSNREVTVPLGRPLQVGFSVHQRVSQKFIDLGGKPVDPARISSVILKSSQGLAIKLTDNQPRWMQASSVARRTTGLEETKIQYSVDSVIVDGSNVVNQSQQRFYVHPNDEWPIQLLLYSARFQARDGLFKFPLGSSIQLEHPDGRVETVPFGPNAEITIRSLVRGIYHVKVAGAPGISPLSPVALSRDQDVQLLLISYLDIGIGAVLAAALAFGLLFVGRPRLFFILGKPRVLAHSIVTAYRSTPGVGALWPVIRRLADVQAYLPAIAAGMSSAIRTVQRFTLVRIRALDMSALPVRRSMGGDSGDVRIGKPFPELLLTFVRRFERAFRPKLDRSTRRRPSPVLAVALFSMLVLLVAGLPNSGAANSRAAQVQQPENPIAERQEVSTSLISSEISATPIAQAQATVVIAPTAQPTMQSNAAATIISTPQQIIQPTAIPAPATAVAALSTPQPLAFGTILRFNHTLSLKSRGDDVVQLQLRLRELGYFDYPTNSGYFGDITFRAVARFQAEQGLQPTGIVDSQTIDALNRCGKDCAQSSNTGDSAQ